MRSQRKWRRRYESLDGILHLVGGWKPGWSDEVTDWLNARLVTTLLNVSEAFEGLLLAAPVGRLAIISSTVVTHNGPPSSAYAAAKLAAKSLGRSTQRAMGRDERRRGDSGGQVRRTPSSAAAALVGVWDLAPGARVVL